nr:NlpC/P60 family protein [uncultured Erythrobacter sp.]
MADLFANAASNLLGCSFRLHGRRPETGLDCVGLVLASLDVIGRSATGPQGYGLRNKSVDPWFDEAEYAGFRRTHEIAQRGDLLLAHVGPAQHHLAILDTTSTIIHAHAGLRRVVRQPLEITTTVIARWRLTDSI